MSLIRDPARYAILPAAGDMRVMEAEAMASGWALRRSEGTLWWQRLVGSVLGILLTAVLFMIHEGICPGRLICNRPLRQHQRFP